MRKLKFLQVGLGSMGKRRIRCLLHWGVKPEQITGFDLDEKQCKAVENKYKIKTFTNFQEAMAVSQPDAFIISTPPNQHSKYFLCAAKNRKHFFVEHTTVENGYRALEPLLNGSFVAARSCTFRYFPAVKKINKLVNNDTIGKILSFQYHLGQYLPDWHPWEDYRKVYFSQKETGACREMFPFELTWLTNLFKSDVARVTGLIGKLSDLDMPADDIYSAILQFKNSIVGNVVIDVLARTPFRTLRIIGSAGVIEWEWLNYTIRIFGVKDKKWQTIKLAKGENEKGYVNTEDMYHEEIKKFLDAIQGKIKYPYSFREDWKNLKTLFALEKSAKTGRIIKI